MTLVKYRPNNRLATTSFDKVFEDFFGKSFFNDSVERDFIPSADIAETDKAFELSISVPGIAKDEISVEVDKRVLTVSGERKLENKEEGKKYKKLETHYGSFKRSFKLPENVDDSAISANYENGILELTIPKSEEVKTSKVIKVK